MSAPSSFGHTRHNSRRYRTINYRSEVDENLFGEPHRVKHAQQMRENRQSANQNNHNETNRHGTAGVGQSYSGSPERTQRKHYVKHVTKDLIRDIL
jgi:hypothetical protein